MGDAQPPPEVLFPNLKRRFSGITSTMIQVLPRQAGRIRLAVCGRPLPGSHELPRLTWREVLRATAKPHEAGHPTIFHTRRNNEMIVGLALKALLHRRLHLIFTSVAQRQHSALTRFLYRRMDTLLSTSERSASHLKRAPAAIIPHGVDTRAYQPAADRAAAWAEGGLPGERGVGIFGRVRPNKGHAEFVDALCSLLPERPGWTAVIIGQTTPRFRPFENSLRSRIKRAGCAARFAWLGKRPFEELPAWFQRMSLVVAAPHTEGFGLTCLEAMASGTPVLATRTGGFEMVIRPGIDGELVPCCDAQALERALRELTEDPERLETMGHAARQRIQERFTIEEEAEALVRIYRRIQASYAQSPQ